MVEHLLAKEKAAGSNPVFRSIPSSHSRSLHNIEFGAP